jgi:hypothetical protein
MNSSGKFENSIDILLWVLFVLPVLTFVILGLLTAPYCSGWNEGSLQGTCTIPGLQDIYNTAQNSAFMYAIFGIFMAPLVAIGSGISLVQKILRYGRGYRPGSAKTFLFECLRVVPIVIIFGLLLFIFAR